MEKLLSVIISDASTLKNSEFKFAFKHSCGGFAFRYSHKPARFEVMHSGSARHLDGSPIEGGEVVACDSCGSPVREQPLSRDVIPWI